MAIAALSNPTVIEPVSRAAAIHRQHRRPGVVQLCTRPSFKTGRHPDDRAYRSQSARAASSAKATAPIEVQHVPRRAPQEHAGTRHLRGGAQRIRPMELQRNLKRAANTTNAGTRHLHIGAPRRHPETAGETLTRRHASPERPA